MALTHKEVRERNTRMYELYQQGYTMKSLAALYSMTHQGVSLTFRRMGLKTRATGAVAKNPFIELDGKIFRFGNKEYYCEGVNIKNYLWMKNNGSVPKGFVVIRVDRNPHNNDIKNFKLISRLENIMLLSKKYENRSGVWYRQCSMCKEFKELENYYSRGGKDSINRTSRCKKCYCEYMREWESNKLNITNH